MTKTKKEINRQAKMQLQNSGNALRVYTELRIKDAWEEITDEIRERLDMEYGWFTRNGLAKGMLMLKDFMDAARKIPGVKAEAADGFLAGSAVAYCLGLTG